METLPHAIAEAYVGIYGNHPLFSVNDWWYQHFIRYFIDVGVPEEGIVGILKKHRVPQEMVKRYGATTGLVPEQVAKQILTSRHRPSPFDNLSIPKTRITRKTISDYRVALERELRLLKMWEPAFLEELVQTECYNSEDEYISRKIKRGITPESWAKQLDSL